MKLGLDTQHDAKIKKLQSDQGGEYMSKEYLKANGTIHSLTMHDTLEQNGVAKHLNQTLVEHACAMHYVADLLKFL